MKTTLILLAFTCLSVKAIAQDTTTVLAGKNLVLSQNSTDSVLANMKLKNTNVFTFTVPQVGTERNPYLAIGYTHSAVTATPPYLSIGGSWCYSGVLDPTKAKFLLYGSLTNPASVIGMGVSTTRGLEFYKGASPGYYFNGRVSVANGGGNPSTVLYDSAVIIGRNWTSEYNTLPYLVVEGGSYTGSGDATRAKIRIFGNTAANIMGLGVSSVAGVGMEYFSGPTGNHTFYGHLNARNNIVATGSVVLNGKTYENDTLYLGATTGADRISANYLSLGRGIGGAIAAPARIELNGSYADEPNKPLKSKLILYGSSEAAIMGFGITSTLGLEVFTGSPGKTTIHGLAKYDVNRASTFDARTLVDKGYVDSVKGLSVGNAQWTGTNSATAAVSRMGNVGIGGAASVVAEEKLAVNGTIKTRRMLVTAQGWADYVFDSAYQLAPVTEVAAYIKQNRHLPGMPAASVVEREGLDAGDIIKQQQVKIEELTLYIIEQDAKQRALQSQLDQQMKMIQALMEKRK